MSPPTPERERNAPRRPLDLWCTEQLESVAIAIAMALVLKFFIIEAYQIPSGSMQPTILGDRLTGIKDRVIADKLCTMLRDPRRWEVMIFRFPSDERRLYVKRIVGLPGETLEIKGGDVWIDGGIARKPDHVNESVLKTIQPVVDGGFDLKLAFRATGTDTDGADITINQDRAVFPPDTLRELQLTKTVKHVYTHGYDLAWRIRGQPNGAEAVADLDVSLRATLDEGADGLRITLRADDGDTVFFLPADGSGQRARVTLTTTGAASNGSAERVFLDATDHFVPTGRPIEITARSVDRRIVLSVDGDEWLRYDDDLAGPRTDLPKQALVSLGVRGGGAIEDVIVRRDIYYLPRTAVNGAPARWEVPDDSYFGLGDNTQSSYDSRQWRRDSYRMGDEVVSGFHFPPPAFGVAPPDANSVPIDEFRIAFADSHGDVHTIDRREVDELNVEPAPFIHRRYLLGKVLAVFWPVYKPFRWKLVR